MARKMKNNKAKTTTTTTNIEKNKLLYESRYFGQGKGKEGGGVGFGQHCIVQTTKMKTCSFI